MKSIIWNEADKGTTFTYGDIPAELVETAEEWRQNMIEAAAEASEELMDKYLGGDELTEEEIVGALRQRTLAGEIQPMLCGSAFKKQRCSTDVGRSCRIAACSYRYSSGSRC